MQKPEDFGSHGIRATGDCKLLDVGVGAWCLGPNLAHLQEQYMLLMSESSFLSPNF